MGQVLGLGKHIRGARTSRRSAQVFQWTSSLTSKGERAEIALPALHNHQLSRYAYLHQPRQPHLITMVPLHATMPFAPPLCIGEEHEADLNMLFQPTCCTASLTVRHAGGTFSATPKALTAILGAKDIYSSARTRRCAWCFCQMSVSRFR